LYAVERRVLFCHLVLIWCSPGAHLVLIWCSFGAHLVLIWWLVQVFVERLQYEIASLEGANHRAKFGGATGGMNAHVVAYVTHAPSVAVIVRFARADEIALDHAAVRCIKMS
jgi:hypothetical protein